MYFLGEGFSVAKLVLFALPFSNVVCCGGQRVLAWCRWAGTDRELPVVTGLCGTFEHCSYVKAGQTELVAPLPGLG